MDFSNLGLSSDVLRAVTDAGYTQPTPIQAQAIPEILSGRDILGIAQTGTGKTAGFTLPMIDRLAQGRARARMPRTLVLEPTRELAMQVSENFETYGKYHKLTMALLIGGVSFNDQARLIDRGVDVLIATPGRLLDHFERGKLMLGGVEILVVDEADRMLDMGFIPDVEKICKLLPPNRQTLFFSATMPKEIQRLTEAFLRDPVRVEVAPPASAAATVVQALLQVDGRAKRQALRRLIRSEPVANAIIFCNRKRDVDTLYRSLKDDGFSVAALHGDLEQRQRIAVLEQFRADQVQLLVASDVAARGLDIPKVSHIFNFDVPIHAEDYIHRIGRTGRAGREGHAFMLASTAEAKYVDAIERMLGNKIPRIGEPAGAIEPAPLASVEAKQPAAPRTPRASNRKRSETRKLEHPVADAAAPRSQDPRSQGEVSVPLAREPKQPLAAGMGEHVPAFLLRPVPGSMLKPVPISDAE